MDADFDLFMNYLFKAGLRMEPHYFQLVVAGSKEQIFRERVYCYELYHQLRSVMNPRFTYMLDGEVDKSGHPIIRRNPKPDLIVHKPGGMNDNLVVIEVKPMNVKRKELRADLKKLQGFLSEANYYRAIILVYGTNNATLPDFIIEELQKQPEECTKKVLLVWHAGSRRAPKVIDYSKPHLNSAGE